MLYYLGELLQECGVPGMGIFQYLTFRAAAAIIIALLIALVFGRRIIDALKRRQIGEDIRDLGLEGQSQKRGTPTMGGLIILTAVLVPMALLADFGNVYVRLIVISTVWLGLIGFLDDYIKVFRHNKAGLDGKFKIVGQVGLGSIVGTMMWLSPDVSSLGLETTVPFLKDVSLDYVWWPVYIVVAILVITGVSNGANLTDGLDGLNTGVAIPVVVVLGVFAYVTGNFVYSNYLGLMFVPGAGELLVFAAALAGALIGFMWYNGYPAQVFMGDTGSLAIGGVIAVMALLIRKELLLPVLCGVYVVETGSVLIQRTWFKITKRRYGEGRRVFLMSPLHHHYQKKGFPESKIVIRFVIISVLLAAITLTTLKVR